MTDWAATGSMLSGLGTIGGGIAIVIAAFLGRQAASNFRKQKVAEREIDHAERALASAYKLQSAISFIRSPLSTATELDESREELDQTKWFKDLTEDKRSRIIQSNVFYRRIRRFEKDFDEANSLLPFVKAYFGEQVYESLRDLIHCRHTVRVYADAYARDEGHDPKHSRRNESFIWEGGLGEDGSDPIETRVVKAISTLEGALLPTIRTGKPPVKAPQNLNRPKE